ncbi:protein bric-a-brac 2 isoform X3 [Spodoptera frugiperda]|uniref:Protein bric-a-brac 2 isoform X3 n=1 Tax=Spodoptera frugiperda TaxID=7108 RepID=A0A9R0D8H4_SPOFR|nr:protein bric-a-brac 2 isoform X3 [Spodoptera frugiperda]
MSQQYSLRWNNHQPNFISMFTTLLNTQTLVDVTLSADGKQLLAHKVVLSACSTYFQSLFVDNPSPHPIVILKDVTYADLRTMVDFMYCGEVNVTEEQLPKVLDTAKLLKIKGLTEMPDSTSLTRSQGTSAEFQNQGDSMDSQRQSPAASPSNKRRRRRKSSSGSTSLNVVENEQGRADVAAQTVDAITLSSVPQQQRRMREYHEIRTIDNSQQVDDTTEQDLNVEQIGLENTPTAIPQATVIGLTGSYSPVVPPGGQWTMMEHSYPRYTNACLGAGALQQDPGMYINNVINPHMDGDINYGQSLGVAGPSPGPSCVDVQAAQEPNPTPTPKRRRTTNPQSEENFQRALEAVRFGGIGFCKAARMFGVNNRTLWLEYKKKGYPNNRPSIKSRIKREHTTPPPEHKEEQQLPEQQMALVCPQHQVPPGFIESNAAHGFPLQGVAHNSPLNILGVNFNSMQ